METKAWPVTVCCVFTPLQDGFLKMNIKGKTLLLVVIRFIFEHFFRFFMARKSKHIAKAKKIKNGGCVALELLRMQLPNGNETYYITDESVSVVYGGFE